LTKFNTQRFGRVERRRIPALYIVALGALRHGAVLCPLFPAFGPEPIHQRMSSDSGKVPVTTRRLYKHKIAPQRDRLPDLEHVLIVDAPDRGDAPEGTLALPTLMAESDPLTTIPATRAEDHALLHFTSGTTEKPRGAVHVHGAALMHYTSARYALDLHWDDVF
jgi:acetyl-CoA synthetase